MTAIPQLTSLANVYKIDSMVSKFANLKKEASKIYLAIKKQPQSRFGITSIGDTPPTDYRQESVLPTCEDIKEDKNIFVRPAVIDGGYKDKDHYLDVQFRLMKQDFVIPLRQGIQEFQKNGMKRHFSSCDLRMYYGVHILGFVAHDSIDHVLCFDTSKLKSVMWNFSKRLIFGSLVCLSKDGFETMVMATISNRDPNDLKEGYVNINVKSGLDTIFNSTARDEFVMAETVTLYESYCHVLEKLQEMSDNLPLLEHIISCEKKVKPPQYLIGETVRPFYDLSPLMKDSNFLKVPVLVSFKWPSSNKMCLNQSQRKAAYMALTKRLAIIQGPPGTGKTYVGLKVVETILKNQFDEPSVAARDTPISGTSDPVLVVCYTNHALDQFLEGILQFCKKGIIRVGGQSKSSCLEPFNLKNKRRAIKLSQKPSDISLAKSKMKCSCRLEELAKKVQATSKDMEHIVLGTCNQEKLLSYNVIHDRHKQSLLHDERNEQRNSLTTWLNVKNDDPEDTVAKILEINMTRLILRCNFSMCNSELSDNMAVEARATLYLKFVSALISLFEREIEILQTCAKTRDVYLDIENYVYKIELCKKEILPDTFFELVLEKELFQKIKEFPGEKAFPNSTIKAWLLGLHKSPNEQLKDLERLLDRGSDSKNQAENDMEKDDVKRVVADLEDDDYTDEEYLSETKAQRNNVISILQRLEELGLDDEIGQTRNNYRDWQQVSKPLSNSKLRRKIRYTEAMTIERESTVKNVWELDMKERFALYKLWIDRCKTLMYTHMEDLVKKYKCILAEQNELIGQENVSILRSAKVIGMTTTGAAKYRSALQAVGCKIIIVEEAAEVLEAHIVTALNKHCEHLILIGDHQQLRPSPVVYELAKGYGLEISLFERLVKNQFPHVVLQEQHRMRPEISKIMRHIYPDLKDHLSVKEKHLYSPQKTLIVDP